ncbi:hypothetical protein [Endozoicomonas sp. ALB115]|uniref:hypothetical protein n=1 Tax=Endozoicomonas sp. ALB115 TaxID=3403074 RepID=UPI003BB5F6DF
MRELTKLEQLKRDLMFQKSLTGAHRVNNSQIVEALEFQIAVLEGRAEPIPVKKSVSVEQKPAQEAAPINAFTHKNKQGVNAMSLGAWKHCSWAKTGESVRRLIAGRLLASKLRRGEIVWTDSLETEQDRIKDEKIEQLNEMGIHFKDVGKILKIAIERGELTVSDKALAYPLEIEESKLAWLGKETSQKKKRLVEALIELGFEKNTEVEFEKWELA